MMTLKFVCPTTEPDRGTGPFFKEGGERDGGRWGSLFNLQEARPATDDKIVCFK